MWKLTLTGFILFISGLGSVIIIYKNINSLKSFPQIDMLVLFIAVLTIIGLIAMFKGIHFSLRKKGFAK